MPPKSITWPPRRTHRTTARKSIPPVSAAASINFRPPSPPSTTNPTSESSHTKTSPTMKKNSSKDPPHPITPICETPRRNSEKTLVMDSGLVNTGAAGVCVDNNAEKPDMVTSGKSPVVDDEAQTVTGSGVEVKGEVILPSLVSKNDETLIDHGPESVVSEVEVASSGSGTGKGKRKIVRRTVRVVRRVIKRVPKGVFLKELENRGLTEKNDNGGSLTELTGYEFVNDGLEKSLEKPVEKTSLVTEAENTLTVAEDNAIENLNFVNNVIETSKLSTEIGSISNAVDELKEAMELDNDIRVSEPAIAERLDDLSGVDFRETKRAKFNGRACVQEQMVSGKADDQRAVEINNVRADVDMKDSPVCFPGIMEDEKVKSADKDIIKSDNAEEMGHSRMEEGYVMENPMNVANKEDVGAHAAQNSGPVGASNVAMVEEKNECPGEPESSKDKVESSSVGLKEGLLLSEQMEALERRKRRKTQIFVGGLDKEAKEADIRKAFEKAGAIVEVRLVMNGKTGKNKGFAFVRFATADDAKNALSQFSKVEICGKLCGAKPEEGNDTIFLGNIDRKWKTEDLLQLLQKAGIGKIDHVILKTDPNNMRRNCGFAFLEFETNRDAEKAFCKFQKKNILGKTQKLHVKWAQPLVEPAEEEILKVKSVYAEHLPASWDELKVKEYFKTFGEIENVVLDRDISSSKRNDFAFINFATRDAALACVDAINRERLRDNGSKVKITAALAKPHQLDKQKKHACDPTKKQVRKEKPNVSKAKHGRPASSSCDRGMVATRYSTTEELMQILRRQAANNVIPPHASLGMAPFENHLPMPGSRPFPNAGPSSLYPEPRGLPRMHVENSHPISGQSGALSRGIGVTSLPYNHRGPGFTSESFHGRNIYPADFQTRERAPYLRDHYSYRRY